MKKNRIFLAAALIFTLAMPSVAWAKEPGTIHVKGTGVVLVQPDVAAVHVAVEEKAPTGAEAQKKNNETVEKVRKALLGAGIQKENIITTHTSLAPAYRYEDNGKRVLEGYEARMILEVYTNDVDGVGKYVDAAVKAGAKRIDNVEFSISDHNRYYEQALQTAVKNAESSAKSIAKAYGKPLGQLVEVVENTGSPSVAEQRNEWAVRSEMAMDKGASGVPTKVHYDKIQVFADLSVTYTLS